MPVVSASVLASQTFVVLGDSVTVNWGPVTPPEGSTVYQVVIDRTLLSSGTLRVNWTEELSTDGGNTWIDMGGGGTNGQAGAATESTTIQPLGFAADANTRVR